MDQNKKRETEIFACRMRRNIIEQVFNAQSGHPGGSLSSADVLAVLYNVELKVDPSDPAWPERDRFVLSKGHCTPALYAALAQKGFFPEEDLSGFRQIHSYLQGHPSMRSVPGVDMSTGSLGQGISASVGMAMMGKLDEKDYRVYALLGDGELQEGEVWEAFMAGAHYKLDNLTAFLDHNGLQIDGDIKEVMNPENVCEKFAAFGWNVINIDGHDLDAIYDAIRQAKACKGKPTVVVCETHKGQGVSFMKDQYGWHGSAPKQEQRDQAIAEIDAEMARLQEV
ncbi:MAG: transketolase [Eubacteriales bacterium]|jgi:transketolase|nr:transketolase [Eubacteriales bacterium]NCU25807.1 transketolase [Candidatus Nomurabacteria bacterium]